MGAEGGGRGHLPRGWRAALPPVRRLPVSGMGKRGVGPFLCDGAGKPAAPHDAWGQAASCERSLMPQAAVCRKWRTSPAAALAPQTHPLCERQLGWHADRECAAAGQLPTMAAASFFWQPNSRPALRWRALRPFLSSFGRLEWSGRVLAHASFQLPRPGARRAAATCDGAAAAPLEAAAAKLAAGVPLLSECLTTSDWFTPEPGCVVPTWADGAPLGPLLLEQYWGWRFNTDEEGGGGGGGGNLNHAHIGCTDSVDGCSALACAAPGAHASMRPAFCLARTVLLAQH